jgi:hypothetical protein
MEHLLFVPSTRLHDRIENGGENFHMYRGYAVSEVQLNSAGQELVMNGHCNWTQFTEALGNQVVWIGENTFLDICEPHSRSFGTIMDYDEDGHLLSINAEVESPDRIHAHIWANSVAQASTAIHLLFRLLTASGARMVEFDSTAVQDFELVLCPVSSLAISQLMQQCPSLTHLHFKSFILDEENVRALWAGAGTNIEIVLEGCTAILSGINALIESFRNNLGPTQLIRCDMPIELFTNGLVGNNSVKILKINPTEQFDPPLSENDMRNLVQSLSQNQGLEELDFGEHALCDENWSLLCQSVARHPALERMDVTRSGYLRTEMLLEMLKVNTALHSITGMIRQCDRQILQNEISPRLLVNRYRPRVRALRTQTNANFLRAKLLGRALHSVNGHPTVLWMFLTSHKDHLMRGVQE